MTDESVRVEIGQPDRRVRIGGPETCGFWCWPHERLPCRWAWLCWVADRRHYPGVRYREYVDMYYGGTIE